MRRSSACCSAGGSDAGFRRPARCPMVPATTFDRVGTSTRGPGRGVVAPPLIALVFRPGWRTVFYLRRDRPGLVVLWCPRRTRRNVIRGSKVRSRGAAWSWRLGGARSRRAMRTLLQGADVGAGHREFPAMPPGILARRRSSVRRRGSTSSGGAFAWIPTPPPPSAACRRAAVEPSVWNVPPSRARKSRSLEVRR